ncbi:site-2 protease family protein [Exiguobacterium antarcticum]|uniref:Site-2 protease family protein n=1 Tax=Exiguobacterium antarcticum TaxID=132920 RepID=A0ABT6R280_9BACL|nr:site-2 protease family protein [Exiguobacterium antarcticum]MDI3235056.1 site-2 protease family protein [Exiguobacterium antarcticum]
MDKKRWGGLAVAGAFLLSKGKVLLALLKFSKFGGTLISFGISLLFYAQIFGVWFGVGLLYLLFIHEMGHLAAAKRLGFKTGPAIFVPFMGAVIGIKDTFRTPKQEAILAYGGPLAGLLSLIPLLIGYALTGNEFWLVIFHLGALLNLFNLLPVSPLDGGRILAGLPIVVWVAGLAALIAYGITHFSIILLLIAFLGGSAVWKRYRFAKQYEDNKSVLMLYRAARSRVLQAKVEQEQLAATETAAEPTIDEIDDTPSSTYDPIAWSLRHDLQDLRSASPEEAKSAADDLLRYQYDSANDYDALLRRLDQRIEPLIEAEKSVEYHQMPKKQQTITLVAYLALGAILFIAFEYSKGYLPTPS